MKAIPWEDELRPEQCSLVVGSLLGDARLECRSKLGTARFRVHHTDSQKEYVFCKYNLLKPFVDKKPWSTRWLDQRSGKIYISWFFHTRTSSVFTPWWRFFYPEGVKVVPKTITDHLDPMALAVWFMDDGCFQRDRASS